MDLAIQERSFGTHSGTFHADEVTACALLLHFTLIDRDKIIRTRDLKKLACCEYVCDVGGLYDVETKRFDHHQSCYQGAWSSAGMIWDFLRRRGIVDQATYEFCNRSLISGIDAHDNGQVIDTGEACTFSQVVSNFVPPSYCATPQEQDQAFFAALEFVLGHLQRLLERFRYIQSYRQKVAESMSPRKPYLLFEEGLPWLESFFDLGGETHPALFVVMPSSGQWKLRGIPPTNTERMKVRKRLPEKWAGLLEEDLRQASGIPGAIFCHKGRFISVWKTKEDALQALSYVIAN